MRDDPVQVSGGSDRGRTDEGERKRRQTAAHSKGKAGFREEWKEPGDGGPLDICPHGWVRVNNIFRASM